MVRVFRPNRFQRRLLLHSCVIGVGLALSPPAESQVLIGGSSPSVAVDMTVLDELGPELTLPEMLIPGVRAAARPLTPMRGAPNTEFSPRSKPPLLLPANILSPEHAAEKTTKNERKDRPERKAAPPRPEQPPMTTASAPSPRPTASAPSPRITAQSVKLPTNVVKDETPATPPMMPPSVAAASPPAPTAVVHETPPPVPTPVPTPAPAPVRLAAVPPIPEIPKAAPTVIATAHGPDAIMGFTPPPRLTPASVPSSVEAAPVTVGESRLTVPFAEDAVKLPESAKAELKALALKVSGNPDMKLQILAYATGTDDSASKARRTSLSRALAVRSFLTEQDVSSTRIEVRALGHHVKDNPNDRVDIVMSVR